MYGTSLPVPKVELRVFTCACVYGQEKVHLYNTFLLYCKLEGSVWFI